MCIKLAATKDELSKSQNLVSVLRKELEVRSSPVNMAIPPTQVSAERRACSRPYCLRENKRMARLFGRTDACLPLPPMVESWPEQPHSRYCYLGSRYCATDTYSYGNDPWIYGMYGAMFFGQRQLGIQRHHPVDAIHFQAMFSPSLCCFVCWGNTGSFEGERSASSGRRIAVAMCRPPGKADGNVGCVQTEPSQV